MCYFFVPLPGIRRIGLTHVVLEVHDGKVIGRSTEDLADFAKASKVPLDHILFVVGWRHILALDHGAVRGRHAAEALCALRAEITPGRRSGFKLWIWGCC